MHDGVATQSGSGGLASVQHAGAYTEGYASSRLSQDRATQDHGGALHRCASAMHDLQQCVAVLSQRRRIFLENFHHAQEEPFYCDKLQVDMLTDIMLLVWCVQCTLD